MEVAFITPDHKDWPSLIGGLQEKLKMTFDDEDGPLFSCDCSGFPNFDIVMKEIGHSRHIAETKAFLYAFGVSCDCSVVQLDINLSIFSMEIGQWVADRWRIVDNEDNIKETKE